MYELLPKVMLVSVFSLVALAMGLYKVVAGLPRNLSDVSVVA
jgi:hypothetical protein